MTNRVAGLMVFLALTAAACAQEFKEKWEVTGMGGAGGMYTPTISPFDKNLMFLSCDMSGSYRSADGGKSWQLIHFLQLRSSRECRPAFLDKKTVYWAEDSSLRVSSDAGVTWKAVAGPWKETITSIAVGAGQLCVGGSGGAWASGDAGKTWSKLGDGACAGIAIVGDAVYTANKGKISQSRDLGKTSRDITPEQAKGNVVISFAGTMGGPRQAQTYPALLAVIDKVGTVKSTDGEHWEVVQKWEGQKDVLLPANQSNVAYAAQEGGHEVWRTGDGGKTWKSIFHMGGQRNVELAWTQTFLKWDYSISHLGIGIDPSDPNVVMMTSEGDFYRSNDGGGKWFQCQNEPVGNERPQRFRSIGLEVTSLWGYYFDPNDPSRHYIAYTDIGFARSTDKGRTWCWSAGGCPWNNTFYELAFDPHVKGRLYAATSNRHDIPHWTHLDANRPNHAGGVCVSDDYGANWKVLGKGLPKLPCTSILADPKSPEGRTTLYTTLYEGGLYKSTDGGATWEKRSSGLGNEGNLHAIRVRMHPKSGNLYCLITALRKGNQFPVPGGLWMSVDGGETWKDLTTSTKFPRPTDFALDPTDERTIYINASTIPGASIGGIYKTTDGGQKWQRLIGDDGFAKLCGPNYYEGSTVNLHPDDPKIVYVGTSGHGLWYSTDAGKTWAPYKSFPFGGPQNVAFDPADHKKIVVTTFGGGAWRGPYLPEAR